MQIPLFDGDDFAAKLSGADPESARVLLLYELRAILRDAFPEEWPDETTPPNYHTFTGEQCRQYWQVRLRKECREIIAFALKSGMTLADANDYFNLAFAESWMLWGAECI